MGAILRSLDDGSESGRQVQKYFQSRELVPAHLVIAIWIQKLDGKSENAIKPGHDILVLDGLPRSIEQAKLVQIQVEVKRVIHLVCDDESILHERIDDRDEGRQDDTNAAVIRHRLDVYRAETEPLLDWYPPELIVAVDAACSPTNVSGKIATALKAEQSVTRAAL